VDGCSFKQVLSEQIGLITAQLAKKFHISDATRFYTCVRMTGPYSDVYKIPVVFILPNRSKNILDK
jgi:hypothetical protein